MKKLILTFGFFLLLLNTIIGFLFTNYILFNWMLVNALILINALLLFNIFSSTIKKGYKVSFSFLYPSLGFLACFLAFLSPSYIEDNIFVVGILVILIIQLLLYFTTRFITSKTNNENSTMS